MQKTFTIDVISTVSAGIFTPAGYLVRTLFSGQQYAQGSYPEPGWDHKDDQGNLVPPGTYIIKLLVNQCTYQWEGAFIGNTSTNQTGANRHRALQGFQKLCGSDKYIYYSTGYNEQRTSCFKFDKTAPQVAYEILTKGATVTCVACDTTNTYWAAYDANDQNKTFVFVTKQLDDTEAALGASQPEAVLYGRTYNSAINQVTQLNAFITGLAVNNNYIAVARGNINQVSILDKQGNLLATTVINGARELCFDGNGSLWLIHDQNSVAQYSIQNGTLSLVLPLVFNLLQPFCIAVNSTGLAIADADYHDINLLDATGNFLSSFGQAYTASAPIVSPQKFYFSDNLSNANTAISGQVSQLWNYKSGTCLWYDTDGSYWIIDTGNNRLMHMKADNTFIEQVMFIPDSLDVNVCGNDPTRVFSDYLEFKVDYTAGTWELVNNWGANALPRYDDGSFRIRNHTYLNGTTYAMVLDNNVPGRNWMIVELEASGLRYTGLYTPDITYGLQQDGSLLSITPTAKAGDKLIVKKMALTGYDANNNPTWGPAVVLNTFTMAANNPKWNGDYNSISNLVFTDDGTLIIFDASLNNGYHLGGIKQGDTKWKWMTAGSHGKNYTGPYLADGSYDNGNSVLNAGSKAMALGQNIFWGYHGEFWKGGYQVNKWQHVHESGLFLGVFGTDWTQNPNGEGIPGVFIPFAGMAGNSFSGCAVMHPTDPDVAYIYHNDESWHGGVHRWKISGLTTITLQTVSNSTPF